jgi:hypothetical protein
MLLSHLTRTTSKGAAIVRRQLPPAAASRREGWTAQFTEPVVLDACAVSAARTSSVAVENRGGDIAVPRGIKSALLGSLDTRLILTDDHSLATR